MEKIYSASSNGAIFGSIVIAESEEDRNCFNVIVNYPKAHGNGWVFARKEWERNYPSWDKALEGIIQRFQRYIHESGFSEMIKKPIVFKEASVDILTATNVGFEF